MLLHTKSFLIWIWLHSGLAYIAEKATSSENKGHHPTLVLWLIGIYVAMFGLASQKYENRLDRFENRLNLLVAQMGTDARANTFSALVQHQHYILPVEPDFLRFWITLETLFSKSKPINEEIRHSSKVKGISDIIVRFKNVLGCSTNRTVDYDFLKTRSVLKNNYDIHQKVKTGCGAANLSGAFLDGALLSRANLIEVDLGNSQLYEANFYKADASAANFTYANLTAAAFNKATLKRTFFKSALLMGANFTFADIQNATFEDAILIRANFTRADLKDADLSNADLNSANLLHVKNLECDQLIKAYNWDQALRNEELSCGKPIPIEALPPI